MGLSGKIYDKNIKYPFALVILNNKENIIWTVGLYALIVGHCRISIFPVPGILSVESRLSIDHCLMRRDVFRIALFILLKQIISLFDY